MCCSKSIKVNSFIDSFSVVKEDKEDKGFNNYDSDIRESEVNNITSQENDAPKEIIFQSSESKNTNSNMNINNNLTKKVTGDKGVSNEKNNCNYYNLTF